MYLGLYVYESAVPSVDMSYVPDVVPYLTVDPAVLSAVSQPTTCGGQRARYSAVTCQEQRFRFDGHRNSDEPSNPALRHS